MEKYNHHFKFIKPAVFTKRKNKKKVFCSKDIIVLDIEVTSAWIENGKVIGYEKGKSAEYWNGLIPLALPYIWQISYNDKVYYGREFNELYSVFDDLRKDTEYIIWVHNLSYEFQFLCNLFNWKQVFARSPHKVMKCTPEDFPNIEFRCSYFLTRLSLESWGQDLGVYKLKGDLDYEVVRTPLTKLKPKELAYCERDCQVVYEGIKKYVQRYGNQFDIPLTQTGTVRREVKNRLTADWRYRRFIKKLIPHNAEEYRMLQNVFAGGYTHANRMYAGISQEGIIQHYDFASSYPTVMIAEKYPMTPWFYKPLREIPDDSDFEDNAYIFKLEFSQLRCATYNTYIQSAKSYVEGGQYDNGRVLSADLLVTYVTEQDWLTIRETYEWEHMRILESYKSRKAYLPKPFLQYILELYRNKTMLKGVEGEEELYMQSKQYINSLFGMCVTAILQSDVEFNEGDWFMEKLTADKVNDRFKELRNEKGTKCSYFLSFSWGCYVTAYARRNLWKCIESVDEDMLYCDTDSIFVLGEHDFTWYDEQITEKLRTSCKRNRLNFEDTRPKDKHGTERPLGIFTREDDCTEFLTLGAKRYVERRKKDKKLHLTVSGINKEAVQLLNDDIDNFEEDFDFDKDADCVKKRLATYVKTQPTVKYPDGYVSTINYGINMRRTGYKLTMTDEYKLLINYIERYTADGGDQFLVSKRGWFT